MRSHLCSCLVFLLSAFRFMLFSNRADLWKTKTDWIKKSSCFVQHDSIKYHYQCNERWCDMLMSYPMFSHLQQQKMQIKNPMMRSAPATDNVMIKIWKFTEFHNEKKTVSDRSLGALLKWTKIGLTCAQTPAGIIQRAQGIRGQDSFDRVCQTSLSWDAP